jgi:hypothetical protein
MEDAVRGFAATDDPFFAGVYHRNQAAFTALARISAAELDGLDGRQHAPQLIADEVRTYRRWTEAVGSPIVDGHAADRGLPTCCVPGHQARGADGGRRPSLGDFAQRRRELVRR